MKINPCHFFDLPGVFSQFDLNTFYLKFSHDIPNPRNPRQIQHVLDLHGKGCYVYGGYGEDRKDVWAETYMKATGKFIHLGVDINMPRGTAIFSPFDAKIVDRMHDKDTKIGWGGRLILERNGKSLVLAHLDPDSLTQKSEIKSGEFLGTIGTFPSNGNTFEHLHIQVINHRKYDDFDGYGFVDELQDNPDPFKIEF